MSDTNRQHTELSAAGRARRDAMLGELQAELGLVSRRRHRGAAARRAAFLVVAALGLWWLIPHGVARQSKPTPPIAANEPAPTEADTIMAPRSAIVFVSTDPTALDRSLVSPESSATRILSDDELLAELNRIGRPAGIIRMEGRVWLTAEVADSTPAGPVDTL